MNTRIKQPILITGASGNIGSAIAKELAKQGHPLGLTGYRHFDTLIAKAKQLQQLYQVPISTYPCDITNPQEVEKMCQYFIDIYPTLDSYIHSAGVSYYRLIQDTSIDGWQQILSTNLSSAFYLSKYMLPHLLSKKKGHIIHISSIWGNVGASFETAYSAAKGGLNTLTKALAKELAPSHIQVNAIAPGLVTTPMNAHLSSQDLKQLYEEIPMGRAANPREVGQMVISLLEAPSYLTGQIITMDGGWF